ncbi:MFS transporter [Vulcaniibacterium gelatinicum]|uniref:MFS transporter n=1 Tax=Vulcaniibacterium gelatinicum TaxID=2598725 RepID=UPI0011CC5AA6|nr:MFS transporter [Vulcaniibacterium gelatinicum]
MSSTKVQAATAPGGSFFEVAAWRPEEPAFWQANRAFAVRTLIISMLALHLAFAVWFTWSALVVRLPGLGFQLSVEQRFWLPAMALLMGAVARFPHTFLVLKIGGMWTTFLFTVALLVPIFGIAHVVQDPTTPFSTLLFWAGVAGFCAGGQISSSSANISLWFPKRLGGTALGVNVGIGNLGTSVAQFLVPAVITAGVFGAYAGDPMTFNVTDPKTQEVLKQVPMWPQNAAYVWLIPTIVLSLLVLFGMKNHPARGDFVEQMKVVKLKHTWIQTILYTLTFGTFSGMAAATPTLIKEVFGKLPDAPDPLAWAWIGPLVGALVRPVGGVLADRFGGANVTMGVFAILIGSTAALTFLTAPGSSADFGLFFLILLGMFFGAGIGNASVFKQIVMIFEPRQASPVLGFSAAMAVLLFGFFVPIVLGRSIAATGSPNPALWCFVALYGIGLALNYHYYWRRGAEKPC